ncbi:hypothetical protein [Rhodococcus qingshengii]
MAITPDGAHAYVTNAFDNSVSVIAIIDETLPPGTGSLGSATGSWFGG